MRKFMILAAMLAMMLVAAAPAFAQATAIDEGDDVIFDDSFNVFAFGNQFVAAEVTVDQTQAGDATAIATDDSAAAASVSQSLTVDQSAMLHFVIW